MRERRTGTPPSPPGTPRSSASIRSRASKYSEPVSSPADEPDRADIERLLPYGALPFLCAGCLLLVDSGFNTRFWTSFEAYLSMQDATTDGIVCNPSRPRCAIKLLRDEPAFMESLLVESWRVHACRQACEELSGAFVGVTWAADKQVQLTRLMRYNEWFRANGGALSP